MFRAAILVLLSLCFTASAEAATLHVSTSGSDGAQCTQSAPCKTFAKAYGAAAAGDTIQVAGGTYPRQDVPAGSKAVTFKGGSGVKLSQLWTKASGLTYDGINIDANFVRKATGLQVSGDRMTFKNATVGNIADEKNVISGSGHVIDNVTFHDTIMTPAGESEGVHMECLYAIGVPNLTVRNSTFRDCAVMDLFLTYGDWWSPLPPAYGNITIENNVFAHSERSSNAGWHYFGLYVANNGPNGRRVLDGWTVRNNTFESPAVVPPTGTNTRWVGNVGAWDCASGVTYRYNVGSKCGATDKQVSPASSTASATAPFGWSNPAAADFRLTAGSPAIGAGDPNDAPRTDRDGNLRDSAPDAGAYEYGGVTAPAPAPDQPGPEPTPTPEPEPSPAPTPDTQAPATPNGMAWGTITQTGIGVKWNATTDNVGVTGYRIYRDGTRVGTTTGTSYTVGGLACGKSYTIGLTAVDAAGNESNRAEATGTTSTAACSTAPARRRTPPASWARGASTRPAARPRPTRAARATPAASRAPRAPRPASSAAACRSTASTTSSPCRTRRASTSPRA